MYGDGELCFFADDAVLSPCFCRVSAQPFHTGAGPLGRAPEYSAYGLVCGSALSSRCGRGVAIASHVTIDPLVTSRVGVSTQMKDS
ncbi:unnamed protein product [Lota lota]